MPQSFTCALDLVHMDNIQLYRRNLLYTHEACRHLGILMGRMVVRKRNAYKSILHNHNRIMKAITKAIQEKEQLQVDEDEQDEEEVDGYGAVCLTEVEVDVISF